MGRRKTYERQRVVELAMVQFWKNGFEGAHLEDLVNATGINRFSLYKEFDGKAGLFHECLAFFLMHLLENYRAKLEAKPLGAKNIENALLSLRFGPDYYGCFMLNTITQRDTVPSRSYQAAVEANKKIEQLYLANVAAALQVVETSPVVRSIAKGLLALDQGLHVQGMASLDQSEKDAVVKAVIAKLLPDNTSDPCVYVDPKPQLTVEE